MTAKQARIISKSMAIIGSASIVISFILLVLAASSSDFYTIELKQNVPGNIDFVLIKWGLIFVAVSAVCGIVLKYVDFSIMYDLKSIPVHCTKRINNEMRGSTVFNKQIREALKFFYDGNWGNLDIVHIVDNNDAYENGNGAIIGLYNTIRGGVYIITNKDRTSTKIIFESEY